MDPKIEPDNNSFLYANGAWIARTKIPAERANVGARADLERAGSFGSLTGVWLRAAASAPPGAAPAAG